VLDGLPLPQAAGEQVIVALQMIDKLDAQLAPIDKELRAYARRQPACKALMGIYGIGALTAVTILAELGDARRFSSSRDAVRYSGLETVASNCSSCSGYFGLRDVAGVRDPLAALSLDLQRKRDPQAVGAIAARAELAVADPVVDRAG
jgi:Transposase IS116/IS110/IS902 family